MTIKATADPTFEQFIERLIEEKGLSDVDPDIQIELKKDLAQRAEDRINAELIEHIPADKLEEFAKVASDKSDAEVHAYCKQTIPDFDQVVAAALLNFRRTYLGH